MIHSLNLDSFYLTDEQLENSPSRQDGIDKDTENTLRMYGCMLIQEAGILLSFHQVVMATGQVLLHRFYSKRSMKTFNVKKVAATALWLGAKLEEVKEVREHPRRLLEMVMVAVDRSITRRETPEGRKLPILDLHSKEGEEFRRSLIRYESEMLKVFGFIMNVEHPHRLLISFCQVMFLPYLNNDEKWGFLQQFVQEAWNIANDSLRTTLCLRFKGSVVACGIIFYTARRLKVCLPDCWWELFMVKLDDMCEVCRALHELYLAPKLSFIPVCHQLLPSKLPTPVIAAGAAAVKGHGVTATPTPMLGATPELNTRPGGKPLDPSIRRTIPASESTPNLVVAAAAAANGAADSSAAPSTEGAVPAAGSARKRSRSRSPLDDSRKRQQRDGKQLGLPPLGTPQKEQQDLQQQACEAMAAATAAASGRRSAWGARDKDGDRDPEQDREHSKRSDRRADGGSYARDRHRRRSRSRDRRRSRSRSKDRRRSRSRSRDRRRSRSRGYGSRSRSRDRDRRRDGDYKHSRDRGNRDRADQGRSDKGRDKGKEVKSPDKPPKQQQPEQNPVAPLPSIDQARPSSPKAAGQRPTAASPLAEPVQQSAAEQCSQHPPGDGRSSPAVLPPASARNGDSSKENHQLSSKPNGVSEADGSERGQQPRPGGSAGGSRPGDVAAAQPKPKPVAVRKKQPPAGFVASPPASPNKAPRKAAPAADEHGSA